MTLEKLSLSKLKVRDFRRIENIDFENENKSIICFLGVNGSGKSSLLSIIFKSLLEMTFENSPDYTREIGQKSIITRTISTAEIRHSKNCYGISVEWKFGGESKNYTLLVKNPTTSDEDIKIIKEEFNVRDIIKNWHFSKWSINNSKENDWVSKQVVLFRPSNRFEKPSYEETEENSISPSTNSNWDNKRLLPFSVSSGLQEAEKLILDIVLDMLINNDVERKYFKKISDFIRDINDEYKTITIPKWPYRRVGLGNVHGLNLLSAGELDLLVTAASIVAQQIYIQNKFNIENAGGVVLIDEIDSHLHPELQETVVPLFVKHFPEIQFIISTHSPFVLRSIKHDKSAVIKIPAGQEMNDDFEYMPIENILNIAFDVNGKWSENITKQIDLFENLLLSKEKNIEKIKESYRELSGKSYTLKDRCDRLIAINGDPELIKFIFEKNEESK